MSALKRFLSAILSLLLSVAAVGGYAAALEDKMNIALGKKYEISSDAPNEHSLGTTEKGTKDQLTDGKYGILTDFYGGEWAHFVNAYGRTVTVDLGENMSVEGFRISFIQNREYGIYNPRLVTVSLSEDGEGFEQVASVAKPNPTSLVGPVRSVYEAEFDTAYRARYVRIHFDVQVNTFTDEIEVYGGALSGGEKELSPTVPEEEELYYDNGEGIGVRDIICFHNGYYPADETLANNTKDVFRSYLGYIDEDGNFKDTMFDAVMFLIIQGMCPSGGSLAKGGDPAVLSDWLYLLDNTFGEGINLDALDEATAELKDELSLPDSHKTAVYLSVPYPRISDKAFGDYDGDGADNVISSVDDCVELYLWYVDRVLERFEEKNYQNLDFKGFFWSTESLIEDTNDYEVTLAERCVKGLHDRGLQCVFIPYFQSAGSWMAEDIGFDATIMQPNLSFNEWAQKDPENFMKDFTSTAAKYHFGIQLEMKENLASNKEPYASYFRQYLVSAVQSGMMTDAVHAYYQGAGYGSVYQCAVSSDPELRWLYDSLYKFIKGTLSFPGQPQVNCDTEITVEEDSMYTGNISLEGDWYCDFTVASQAPNGTVMCYPGVGEYRYRPDRGFTGSDSFGISVTMPDGSEKIVTVNVTVTPEGTDVSDTSQEASEAESTPDSGKGGILPYIAGGAVILAGAVCAVVAAVLKKKKKNSGDGSKPESK